MFSMTGYGRATVEQDGRQLTIELKSVNHRFLDIAFRMPRSFSFMEENIRKILSTTLSRGHVDVFATYRNLRSDSKTVSVDEALVGAYQKAIGQLAGMTDVRDDRSIMSYARLSDVLVITEAEEDRDALSRLMSAAVTEALKEMCTMRAREGKAMAQDLLTRLNNIEQMASVIHERYPETVKAYETRLRERIEELIGNNVDEQRLLQEVAVMADRSAISEELVRLQSHIDQVREMTKPEEPVGRKLDFLMQELNREINTISSKSQDIAITQVVVNVKAEIEKMREQVQNIE